MFNISFACSFIFCLAGCSVGAQSPIEHNDRSFTVDLDDKSPGTTLYTRIFESVQPVLLQVTEESLIGDIDKIEALKSGELIILDKMQARGIFVFGSDGTFIRRIGQVGRGPQEYLEPSDFTIDPVRNHIYVLDSRTQKVLKYDLSTGQWLDGFRINQDAAVPRSHHLYYSDGVLYTDLYYYQQERSGDGYHLMRVDAKDGAFMNYFLDAASYSYGIANENRVQNPFHKIDESSSLFVHPLMDTVFLICNGEITNWLTLNSSRKWDRSERRLLSQNQQELMNLFIETEKPMPSDFIVTPDFIYFSYMRGSQSKTVIHDVLKNQDTYVTMDNNLLYRDDYPGMKVLPALGCTGNGGVYMYMKSLANPFFLRALASEGLKENLQSRLAGLNEESNPMVFFYKFRQPPP